MLVLLDSRSYIGRRVPAFSERMARYLRVLEDGDTRERLNFLWPQIERSKTRRVRSRRYHRFLLGRYRHAGQPIPEHAGLRLYLNQSINLKYVAPEYAGPAILIKVDRSFLHPDVHDGWRRVLTGDYRVHTVSGRHLTILKQPHVHEVADILTRAVERCPVDPRRPA